MPAYTLRQLEYLVAVAEYGSVSGAASALHVSQSTLSSGISEMERSLNLQLLVRHHAKGVSLTQAGERLISKARSMLDDAELFERDARDLGSSVVGAVSVGVYSVVAPYIVPELVDVLATEHPELDLRIDEVSLPELNEGILSGRFEIGIGYDFGRSGSISVKRLVDVEPHVVVPAHHVLAKRKSIKLKEIAHESIVLLDLPHSREYFTKMFASAGFAPDIKYRSGNPELVRSLVGRGLGVAVLNLRPASLVSLDGHKFAILEIDDKLPPAHIVTMSMDHKLLTRRANTVLETARHLSL